MFLHIFKKQPKVIALLGPSSNVLFTHISCGIIAGLDRDDRLKYVFRLINGANDTKQMKERAKKILLSDYYDLLFTIGNSSTLTAIELTKEHKTAIPIVFTAVAKAEESMLIRSIKSSGNHLTGFEAFDRDYIEQMNMLFSVTEKSIKKILLPYTDFSLNILSDDIVNAVNWFKKNDFHTIPVAIDSNSDIYSKVVPYIPNVDLVFMPRDSALVSYIDGLVTICNTFRKPLYTSDLVSVGMGASCGFGADEFYSGVIAAQTALRILVDREKPSSIPIEFMPWQPELVLNVQAAKWQNLQLNLQKAESLKNVRFSSGAFDFTNFTPKMIVQ